MNNPQLLDIVSPEQTDNRNAGASSADDSTRRGVVTWMFVLILVIVFGYLTAARRRALGTFADQLADIVRDFRGYDPEF